MKNALIVILVIIVLVLAGYLFFKNSPNGEDMLANQNKEALPENKQAVVGDGPYDAVVYEDEVVYSDTKYGFTNTYPSDWTAENADGSVSFVQRNGSAHIDFTLHKSTTVAEMKSKFDRDLANGLINSLESVKSGQELGYEGMLVTYRAGSHSLNNFSTYWRESKGDVYEFRLATKEKPTIVQLGALDRLMNTLHFR